MTRDEIQICGRAIRLPLHGLRDGGAFLNGSGEVWAIRAWGIERVGYQPTREQLEAAAAVAAHEAEGLGAVGGACPLVEADATRHAAKVAAGQCENREGGAS